MATYVQKFWTAEDTSAVCALQNVAAPGALLLNGTLFNPSTSTISFSDQGFARNVSLTSVNNLSAANFTITGVQNNTVVFTTLAGPNNNTVYTTVQFDIISSVTVDLAVTGIKLGTGVIGYLTILNRLTPNNFAFTTPSTSYALGFSTDAVTGSHYTIYESLADLNGNGTTYTDLVGNFSFILTDGPFSNTTQILQKNDVCNNILIKVVGTGPTSTLTFEFLQF